MPSGSKSNAGSLLSFQLRGFPEIKTPVFKPDKGTASYGTQDKDIPKRRLLDLLGPDPCTTIS